jgi:hypothetical protein
MCFISAKQSQRLTNAIAKIDSVQLVGSPLCRPAGKAIPANLGIESVLKTAYARER